MMQVKCMECGAMLEVEANPAGELSLEPLMDWVITPAGAVCPDCSGSD